MLFFVACMLHMPTEISSLNLKECNIFPFFRLAVMTTTAILSIIYWENKSCLWMKKEFIAFFIIIVKIQKSYFGGIIFDDSWYFLPLSDFEGVHIFSSDSLWSWFFCDFVTWLLTISNSFMKLSYGSLLFLQSMYC